MRQFILWLLWIHLACSKIAEFSSIDEILESHYTLLYFYTPGCVYCNGFDADFVYLNEIYDHNDDLTFAKINGHREKQLAELFGVTSYPTIKLYDAHQKKIAHFRETRTLPNLEKFIAEFSQATPNEATIELPFEVLSSADQLDQLLLKQDNILIAIVSKSSPEWLNYYYPNHFYLQVAQLHPNITFSVVFADETGGDILERYAVSNFPSLILISESGLKTFNSFSTNALTNNNLEEGDLNDILKNTKERQDIHFFKSLEDLEAHVSSGSYEGHKQIKPGMNVGKLTRESVDVDLEYEELLRHIEL
ncbi:hypothetical protein C7M61_002701 [Candidozyma pseudohaemuli]|uniref:Thioredoxin domain-containing protein n=1 Tax=Candidozyma pseudohaemuli TaxID=418784 RepID=A0A2P7YS44_9ASCO|nr:hypothetical protein C7M61_002701 [[Candida] pseudohaemulonii]PSK38762.1 hypothetical protein C7M61_002701 [[Candida] pseudohaemulonii]